MEKIKIIGASEPLVGALRLPQEIFDKIDAIAQREECSKQAVIRYILNKTIGQFE